MHGDALFGGPAAGYVARVAEKRERAERALVEGVAQWEERGHHDEAIATLRGGLALAEFVWAHAAAPPDGRLVVDRLSRSVSRAAAEATVA